MLSTRSPILLLLAGMLHAGCAQAQDTPWPQVVAAARQERSLVFYTGAIANKCVDAVIADFRKAYGIEVQTLKARGGELHERLRVEQASGRFIADVEWTGAPPLHLQARAGMLQALGPLPNLARLRPGSVAEPHAVPVFLNPIGVLVHDKLVKPEELKSWKSLADPKWKGKLVSDLVDTLGAGNVWFDVTQSKLGSALHEGIARNQPQLSREWPVMQRRLAAGEFLVHINQVATDAFAARGLPLRWWVPEEGAPVYPAKVAVLKNAPHPNAARLFVNHLLEPDAQLRCAAEGMVPVVQGVIERLSPDQRALVDVKLLGEQANDPAAAARAIELARTLYRR